MAVRDSSEMFERRGSTLMPTVAAYLRGMPAAYQMLIVPKLFGIIAITHF